MPTIITGVRRRKPFVGAPQRQIGGASVRRPISVLVARSTFVRPFLARAVRVPGPRRSSTPALPITGAAVCMTGSDRSEVALSGADESVVTLAGADRSVSIFTVNLDC
ncbi:hypothetical protein VT84_24470 [Gemmata sp. SH-PL17]|uniref:hypothetical protein n=1 Tax=Gemmata sp. SH-PL17 TaxID=1630693 RepID=UPI0004BB22C9|nr:hypothetical protein [Gemmata sp. SH-PL17]AMV27579.1 hypothetical protein VT84_24470 [Gemmata sp. SH-PL17]